MNTTPNEPIDTGLSDGDAVAALMEGMSSPSSDEGEGPDEEDEGDEDGEGTAPPLDDEGEGPDDEDGGDEGDEEGADDDGEQGGTDPQTPVAAPVADDAVLKVSIDGEERDFTVAQLKGFAANEAATTAKSEQADLLGGRAAAAIQHAMATITEDLADYEGLDWTLAGTQLEPEEFAWHRERFNGLIAKRDRVLKAAQDFTGTMEAAHNERRAAEAKEAVKVLKSDIPDWSDTLYGEILNYGVTAGLAANEVGNITSPAVIKLMHKAMLYDKGKAAVAKKVNQTPSNVRKAGGREAVPDNATRRTSALTKKLQSGQGTDKDAMALLLNGWGIKA